MVYGTVVIEVMDIMLHACHPWNYFDVCGGPMFSYSRWNVFQRDLLYYWLYSIDMLSNTFREDFELSMFISTRTSARYTRWGCKEFRVSRLVANEEPSAFMSLIKYPQEF